jgi:selenium metabolism protein YedF
MKHIVDARGLDCPQPVINAKNAIEAHREILVIVDNETAYENVCRLADSINCSFHAERRSDGIYITMLRNELNSQEKAMQDIISNNGPYSGPIVLVVSRSIMGSGDDALGAVLMKSFIHTLAEAPPIPDVIIFFNSGVKLVTKDSDVIDDLKTLEARGAKLLACGTCINFFNLKDSLAVGSVSNMYEIKEFLFSAGRLVTL